MPKAMGNGDREWRRLCKMGSIGICMDAYMICEFQEVQEEVNIVNQIVIKTRYILFMQYEADKHLSYMIAYLSG